MNDDGDMIWIVERRRASIERCVVELPFGRCELPDELRKVATVLVVTNATAFSSEKAIGQCENLIMCALASRAAQHGHAAVAIEQLGEAIDIVGNLSPEEAAFLVAEARIPVVVPMHYDMFAGNPGEPGELVASVAREAANTAVFVHAHHRPLVFTATSA